MIDAGASGERETTIGSRSGSVIVTVNLIESFWSAVIFLSGRTNKSGGWFPGLGVLVGVGVKVKVGVGVKVDVNVKVGVKVSVGVDVLVSVGIKEGVDVKVIVGV